MTYPNSPGYARNSATSREAAETLYNRDGLHFGVLQALYNNPHGLIVDDVKRIMQIYMKREFDRSTIAARFTELEAAGMIEATDKTAKTLRGKNATIYRATIKGRDYVLNN